MDYLNIDIDDGKYTLIQREGGDGEILRHGEPWLAPLCNVNASKMILAMGYELERLRAIEDAMARLVAQNPQGDELAVFRANSHRYKP